MDIKEQRKPKRGGQPKSVAQAAAGVVSRYTPRQGRLLDARARILEKRAKSITFQHSVFCQTALPYRNPGDDVRLWEREQGNASLLIEAGRALDPRTHKWVEVGLPYGPKARLVLLDLNQSALRTQSPELAVGDSMTSYLANRLGLDTNGRNIRGLKDQLGRLSAATIRLAVADSARGFQVDTKIISAFDLWFPKNENQRVLWPSVVRLSEDYFQSLMAHAVPLREDAIAALAHSAMALDLYSWLAQRLHRVSRERPQFIPWAALKAQFGPEYDRMDNFKRFFRKQLRQVGLVYPEGRGSLDARGITLRNSPPPVAPSSLPAAKL